MTGSTRAARAIRAAVLAAVALGSVAGKRTVEDAPRWMTEKDTVRMEIVRKLLDGGDPARALELIRLIREDGIDEPEVDLYQGVALRQQGMVEDAERMLVRAAAELPRNAYAQRQLCVLYADEQVIEPALAACERATQLDPKDAAGWNNLGWIRLTAGDDPEGALEALRNAVDLDGTDARYRNNLGYAQAATGDHRAALRTFMTTGTPADAHYNVGTAFERAGDEVTALTYYRRALKYDRDHLLATEAVARAETEGSGPDDPGSVAPSTDPLDSTNPEPHGP